MLAYVFQFFDSLAFSVIVESTVVYAIGKLVWKKEITNTKFIACLAMIGTFMTIPYVWFVFPTLFWYSYSLSIILAEIFAFIVESFVYKYIGKLSWYQAFVLSLLANSASFFLGKII